MVEQLGGGTTIRMRLVKGYYDLSVNSRLIA